MIEGRFINLEDILNKFHNVPSIMEFCEALKIHYLRYLCFIKITREQIEKLRKYYGDEMKRPENRRKILVLTYQDNICATVLSFFKEEEEYIWIQSLNKDLYKGEKKWMSVL